MKKFLFLLCFFSINHDVIAQTITSKINRAYAAFEKDPQLKSAIASLYVIDVNTGKVVFEKNSRIGLAPASTLKIITSVTACDMLGKDFTYKTLFGYYGTIQDSILAGSIYIRPSGDPTFGSWRWPGTKEDAVINRVST
ncbi:MAG TPA: D-alanyl-D-alanine carboxypeptidase, partial [Flavisolibacter sp.]|nr:D-alanyl-D-alanine carboxypeptidase [Flavisolibacter sp.]